MYPSLSHRWQRPCSLVTLRPDCQCSQAGSRSDDADLISRTCHQERGRRGQATWDRGVNPKPQTLYPPPLTMSAHACHHPKHLSQLHSICPIGPTLALTAVPEPASAEAWSLNQVVGARLPDVGQTSESPARDCLFLCCLLGVKLWQCDAPKNPRIEQASLRCEG